jgi:hypothetical protein
MSAARCLATGSECLVLGLPRSLRRARSSGTAVPRDPWPSLVCHVLHERLGEPVTLEALGWADAKQGRISRWKHHLIIRHRQIHFSLVV